MTTPGDEPRFEELPPDRREAVARYLELVSRHPELFPKRKHRPLVLDRARLEAFAARLYASPPDSPRWRDEDGEPIRPRVGEAARTPWFLYLVEAVEEPDGSLAAYGRLVPASQLSGRDGVVVVATLAEGFDGGLSGGAPGDVILVRQERHATGLAHWELPRGGGEAGLTDGGLARLELGQETGYVAGGRPRLLGRLHSNTGTTSEYLSFYHVEVTARRPREPEPTEAILEVAWPLEEVWRGVRDGRVTDALTVQGLALFEKTR